MKIRRRHWRWRSLIAVLFLLLGLLLQNSQREIRAAGPPMPEWQDTDIVVPTGADICVDAHASNTVLVQVGNANPVAYNWVTKHHSVINSPPLLWCDPEDVPFGGGSSGRYMPDDGTSLVYEMDPSLAVPARHGRLFVSLDRGVTWEERGLEFSGRIRSLAVSDVDGRAIYLAVQNEALTAWGTEEYSIYFSADAGITCEK